MNHHQKKKKKRKAAYTYTLAMAAVRSPLTETSISSSPYVLGPGLAGIGAGGIRGLLT